MSSNALEFEGDAEPEWLTEDVVFRSSPALAVATGFLAGFGAWAALILLHAMVMSVTMDWNLSGTLVTYAALVAAGLGIHASIHFWRRYRGLSMIVNSWGIVIKRDDRIEQSAAWSEMTLATTGTGWRETTQLADASGQPLEGLCFDAKLPSERRAMLVMRTRLRRLKSARDAGLAPRSKDDWKWWLLGALVIVGIASAFALSYSARAFLAAIADPDSSTGQRAFLLLAFLASLAGIGVGTFGLASGISLVDQRLPKSRARETLLRRFVAERRGELDPVFLVDGVWHQYVEAKELKRLEGTTAAGVVMASYSLLLLIPVSISSSRDATGSKLFLAILFLIFAVSAVMTILQGIELRRFLPLHVRRCGDAYELLRPGEAPLRASLVRAPRSRSNPSSRFGALNMRLRAENGKFYRIDPRFLVPLRQVDQ